VTLATGPGSRLHDDGKTSSLSAPDDLGSRLRSLDVLRGIAVLSVLGAHMHLGPATGPAWLRRVLWVWERGGWIGVDLFFVLSGFLISGLLFREYVRYGHIQPGRFLIRRGFKIYPAFYVLVLYTVIASMSSGNEVATGEVLSELFFVQNYGPSLFNHSWSLAIEEHFYILLALWTAWIIRRGGHPRSVVRIVGVLAVAVLILRVITALLILPSSPGMVHWTHLRLDALAFGVALGCLATFFPEKCRSFVIRHRWVLLVSSLALVIPSAVRLPIDPFVATVGLTGLYLGFGGLLMLAVYNGLGWLPRPVGSALAGIGVYSYSIYLWHVPIREWGGRLLTNFTHHEGLSLPGLLLYLVASVLVGIGMSKLVEIPFLRARDRLCPPRATAVSPALIRRAEHA
jgi:peptidoglycan/LPS O-acetylase OafA/YrhL